jgi:hypothetical protein
LVLVRHGNDTGLALNSHQALRIRDRIRHGDLDHDVLAGAHALLALRRVYGRRSRQDHGVEAGQRQALREVCRAMRNPPGLRHFARRLEVGARQRDDFDVRDLCHRLQMLDAEGTMSRETNFHDVFLFFKIIRPAAVLDAGT